MATLMCWVARDTDDIVIMADPDKAKVQDYCNYILNQGGIADWSIREESCEAVESPTTGKVFYRPLLAFYPEGNKIHARRIE